MSGIDPKLGGAERNFGRVDKNNLLPFGEGPRGTSLRYVRRVRSAGASVAGMLRSPQIRH
jgi:hypothetical protein